MISRRSVSLLRPTRILHRAITFLLTLASIAGLGAVLCRSAACQGDMSMPPIVAGGGYVGELPRFDVVSVKPHKAGDDLMYMHWGQTDYRAENMALQSMIANVYDVRVWLVFGLPPWAKSTHWDIDAKVSAPDRTLMAKLTPDQRRQMIAEILKDRFGFKAHVANQVQPVFVLTLFPNGGMLKPSAPLPPDTEHDPSRIMAGSWHMEHGMLTATHMSMQTLAQNLAGQVGRSIIDRTGLTGEYDITLKWTPEDRVNTGDDTGAGEVPPLIFEALKQQLGLKLVSGKAPVPTVVVDQITQPDAN